jgi:Na+/proline symporter
MSTISTQLNWGSSYIVFDFYKQQINPNASEKKLVAVGRLSTVLLMIISAIVALLMQDAMQLFNLLLVFGAGTGLIFILRWFWWRINAWSEISAMFASGIISLLLTIPIIDTYLFNADNGVFPSWAKLLIVVGVTTLAWIISTFVTKPESEEVLMNFYKKTQPGGPGWKTVIAKAKENNIKIEDENEAGWSVPSGILAMLLGCGLIYSILFSTGYWIYGETTLAIVTTISAIVSGFLLIKIWKRISAKVL